MPVNTPPETYGRLSHAAVVKSELPWAKHALQCVVGGVWIGLYGHCSLYFASQFYTETVSIPYSIGLTSFAHGLILPAAYFAVFFTGCDLFTANAMTVIMAALERKVTWLQVLRLWTISLVGNFAGTVITAGFSQLTGVFHNNGPRAYLSYFCLDRLSIGWGENVINGIGCNLLVCLGFWCAVVSEDGAGKILSMWFAILAFVVGRLEHVVANFFTFLLALFENIPGVTSFDVFLNNFAPVLIGNMTSGCLLTGALWWYAFHPKTTNLDLATKTDLLTALASRVMDEEGKSMMPTSKNFSRDSSSE